MFKYTTLESFFTPDECEILINNSLKNTKLTKAKVGTKEGGWEYNDHRNSSVALVDGNSIFPEIVKKLQQELINQVKVKGYKLDFKDTIYQFTEYKSGEFYKWHTDSNKNSPDNSIKNRHCSVVIQLTDEYTGGELELIDEEEIIKFKNGKGNLFIFLSNLTHRVTEVKSGIRYSLVTWFALKPIPNYSKSLI
jgi:predicted 2-oxoglutarate/Fe(II)-dependent dioxygenase YbiX